jgi:hypothetical protein
LQTQARKLIVDTTKAAELVGPIVLVIDALDEAGTLWTRKPLLDAIAAEFPTLPHSIKIIVTSRDESDIRDSLQACSDNMCIEETEKTAEDIACYIQHRLVAIRKRSRLGEDWPNLEKSQELYNRAGRLFIWASVACNFMEDGRDAARRLTELLNVMSGKKGTTESPLSKLDLLYNGILQEAFPSRSRNGPPADFHYVVGSIVALTVPLTSDELDTLLGFPRHGEGFCELPNGDVLHLSSSAVIIDSLRSILRTDSTGHAGTDGPVRLLHPSLYDFLTSRAEDDFRINVIEQNTTLAIRCLDVMNNQLKFDICKIGDPSLLNTEIEDLSQKLDRYVSGGLRYSCRSFAHHIARASDANEMLIAALDEFVHKHLLQWMETMSLLSEISKAEECLHVLSGWIKVRLQCVFCENR